VAKNLDYSEEIKVDRYNLEVLLEGQAELYGKYAKAWAEAVAEREKLARRIKIEKDKLKEIEAELDAMVRVDWEEYGFKKAPTESAIRSWIILQSEYKIQQKEIYRLDLEKIECFRIENRLDGAKYAFDHRKSSLEGLTKLMLGGYYSKPHVPQEMKDESEGLKREGEEKKIRESVKRRKLKRDK